MSKLEKLTPEQTAAMPAYAQEWIRHVLHDPIDHPAVEEGIRQVYKLAGLNPPADIIWTPNPKATVVDACNRAYDIEHPKGSKKDRTKYVRDNWHKYLGGRTWAGWDAWRAFLIEECNAPVSDEIREKWFAWKAANSAGWWWPGDGFCYVTEHWTDIHLERVGPDGFGSHRLHNGSGPAIAWEGWSVFLLHGVRVPEWVVMESLV